MNLVKWNPARFFDDRFFQTNLLDDEFGLGNWKPVVDIYDNDEDITIKAELPGVEKKDIEVDLKDRVLTIRGERSHEKEVKEDNYHRKERVFGKFHRAFTLPADYDPDKIKADFKDGVLKIEIPKPEKEKPKKIAVH